MARSHILSLMDRSDEALADCDAAIRLEPANVQAHFNCGVIQQRRGRFLDALADLTRVVELAPGRVGGELISVGPN